LAAIGLLGLTPKTPVRLSIASALCALWGAVGWGRVGLSLRPHGASHHLSACIQISSSMRPLRCFVNSSISSSTVQRLDRLHVRRHARQPLVAVIASDPCNSSSASSFFG